MSTAESARSQPCDYSDAAVGSPVDDSVASGLNGHVARRPRRPALARRFEILANDPYRRPDWRWTLAGELSREHRRLRLRHNDPALAQAVLFRRALERGASRAGSATAARRWPALHQALHLRQHGGQARTLVEARLLARQPASEIAVLHGVTPEAADAFGSLFFDIADRLQGRDYIVHHAIRGSASDDLPAGDELAHALKAFAYFGGPAVLNLVATVITNRDELLPSVRLDELQSTIGRLKVRARLAVAAYVLPFTPVLARELLRIQELVVQIERQYDSSWSTNHQNSDLTDPLVAALPGLWSGLLATKPVGASLAANDEHAAGKAAQEASSKDAA